MRNSDNKSVVGKVVEILDCFIDGQPLSLSEISKTTGIPQPTALRLLRELVSANYVSHEPLSRKYSAGVKVLHLSESMRNRIDVRTVSLPFMHQLAEQTKETVQLVIPVGNQGVCIEKVDGSENIRLYSAIGKIVPLYGGAATKAIMAFLSDQRRDELLSQPLEALTPNTKTERCAIEAEIARIRMTGIAVSREELQAGAAGVAAPIFDRSGDVVAGISVAGPAWRLNSQMLQQFGDLVKGVALQISRGMGWRPRVVGANRRPSPEA